MTTCRLNHSFPRNDVLYTYVHVRQGETLMDVYHPMINGWTQKPVPDGKAMLMGKGKELNGCRHDHVRGTTIGDSIPERASPCHGYS